MGVGSQHITYGLSARVLRFRGVQMLDVKTLKGLYILANLSSVDLGKAFEEEWQRRKSELANADWFVPLVLWGGDGAHCRQCSK